MNASYEYVGVSDRYRAWLSQHHQEIPCSRCACCIGGDGDGVACMDRESGEIKVIPLNLTSQCTTCFRWDLRAAAKEAYNRLGYMGRDCLPPMVKAVYDILDEAIDYDRKIMSLPFRESDATR